MNYWEEAFCVALEEANISFPPDEMLKRAAKILEGAHENYGMVHGHDCIPNPLRLENEKLSKELALERKKVHCKVCNGDGRITIQGFYHSSNSECYNCKGEGKVLQ
jgi:hypothetical protein